MPFSYALSFLVSSSQLFTSLLGLPVKLFVLLQNPPASFCIEAQESKPSVCLPSWPKSTKIRFYSFMRGNKGAKVLQYLLSQQVHLSLRRLISVGMCLQADNGLIAGWPGHVSYFRSRLLTQRMLSSGTVHEPLNIYFKCTSCTQKSFLPRNNRPWKKMLKCSKIYSVDCSIDWKGPSIYTQNYRCRCDSLGLFWQLLSCHFSFISFVNVLFYLVLVPHHNSLLFLSRPTCPTVCAVTTFICPASFGNGLQFWHWRPGV